MSNQLKFPTCCQNRWNNNVEVVLNKYKNGEIYLADARIELMEGYEEAAMEAANNAATAYGMRMMEKWKLSK